MRGMTRYEIENDPTLVSAKISRWVFWWDFIILLALNFPIWCMTSDTWGAFAWGCVTFLIVCFKGVADVVYYHTTRLVYSEERLFLQKGWANPVEVDIPLEVVESVSGKYTWCGYFFRYGDVVVRYKGGKKVRISYVRAPHAVAENLMHAVIRAKERKEGEAVA